MRAFSVLTLLPPTVAASLPGSFVTSASSPPCFLVFVSDVGDDCQSELSFFLLCFEPKDEPFSELIPVVIFE